MKVLIRVDASDRIGTGHVSRCLNIARELRLLGAEVRFVTRLHPGNMAARIAGDGFSVSSLPLPYPTPSRLASDYTTWVGASERQDALETIEAMGGVRVDMIVVDHYGLGAEWERLLQDRADRLVVIDDLANRSHDCDFLVDHGVRSGGCAAYRSLVPDRCTVLQGPEFALLGREYSAVRTRSLKMTAEPRAEVERVLVYFGGSDHADMTGSTLRALSDREADRGMAAIASEVVVGPNYPWLARLERVAEERGRTRVSGSLPHLADLMASCDAAVGAGGVSMLERMCLGLPSIVVSVAENQRQGCLTMADAGLIIYVGDCEHTGITHLREALQTLVEDRDLRSRLRLAGFLTVDEHGTRRVAEVLMPTPISGLRVRPAGEVDLITFFNWANEPEVRRQAKNQRPIGWSEHVAWFEKTLNSSDTQIFVLEAGTLPVGQIRFDRSEDETWISYSLDPIVRGRGWAKPLVLLGIRASLPDPHRIFRAHVRPGNLASLAVFEGLGFTRDRPASPANGFVSFRFKGKGKQENGSHR